MSISLSRVIGAGAFCLFLFASGFWLSRSGRPYSSGLFTIHKLIGLAAGVFLILIVARDGRLAALRPVEIAALVVTILIFAGLVIAGGLLGAIDGGSLPNLSPTVFKAVHHILPYLAVLSTAATITLLWSYRV